MREDELVAERVRGLLDRHAGGVDVDDEGLPDGRAFEADPSEDEATPAAFRAHRPAPSLLSRVAARVPVRLDPGRRAAIAIGLAVVVAAVITGAWLLAARPRSLEVGQPAPISGAVSPQGSDAPGAAPAPAPVVGAPSAADAATASSTGSGTAGTAAAVVVDVAGKVAHPGLYHLDAGARVADALAAAGGPRHGVDLTSVNLAAKVVDGQQIVIGRPAGAVPAGQATGAGGAVPGDTAAGAVPPSGAAATVDLNTATLEQLESLPGIGPALGQRILDWRTAHSSFSAIDQLKDVSGIGDVRFADLMPLVTV